MRLPLQFFYRTPRSGWTPLSRSTLRAAAKKTPCGKLTTRLEITWQNEGEQPLTCQLELRVKTDFAFSHYVIPAVLYNGNGWGRGKEPKGLSRGGEPWVFDHRRTAIPACTISENRERFFALFASNESAASLNASCSMVPGDDGTMLHRLLYPDIEKPLTYINRDAYGAAQENFLTLAPGESFTTVAYAVSGAPERECFAAAQVEDAALDLLAAPFTPRYTPEELQPLCCAFAQRLLVEKGDHRLICTGKMPHPDGDYVPRVDFEFGWCGQNGQYARLFLQRGIETNDQSLIELGTQLLDFWASRTGRTGLICTRCNDSLKPDVTADVCNLSYAVAEFAQAYSILKGQGLEKTKWLAVAERIASFLIERFDETNGFGKVWNVRTGACLDGGGTIGAFMIPALCTLYQVTGKSQYLQSAKTACRFYRDRDLARFMCTAGALDTCCIDKETSGPLLAGGIALFELERSGEWLDCAKMAGWYFCSWMFHHDTLPSPGSDFEQYGYRTLGGTSVSAQHHHLDPWGAWVVPQLTKLWEYTGDRHWKQRADLIWANAVQNIAPPEGMVFHGHRRLAGAQNEAYFHCSWGDPAAPGVINEWLVAWPQAFIWNTARFLAQQPDEK